MDWLILLVPISIYLVFYQERVWFGMDKKKKKRSDLTKGFHSVLLAISSQLLKIDGTTNRSGVQYLKHHIQFKYGPSYSHDRIVLLKSMIERDFNTQALIDKVMANSNPAFRLKFIRLLYRMASSNGVLTPWEAQYLQNLNTAFQLPPLRFEQIRTWSNLKISDPYDRLGVNPKASESEIKRAYRKFVLKYHPDRNGGDEPANRKKFEEIRLAYETICRERNIR